MGLSALSKIRTTPWAWSLISLKCSQESWMCSSMSLPRFTVASARYRMVWAEVSSTKTWTRSRGRNSLSKRRVSWSDLSISRLL